jgi:hypothetical protein
MCKLLFSNQKIYGPLTTALDIVFIPAPPKAATKKGPTLMRATFFNPPNHSESYLILLP